MDRAWQELENLQYDWEESPQAFAHRFICQHAAVATKFPNEKFPERDKSIKRKIYHGMPSEAKKRLEAFLGSDYPLNKFMDRVEHLRSSLEGQFLNINLVPKKETATPDVKPSAPPATSTEIEALRQEIARLKAAQQTHDSQPDKERSFPYCAFCRSQTHTLKDCQFKPARGLRFDCLRPHCRRGNPQCPGPSHLAPNQSSLAPQRSSPSM